METNIYNQKAEETGKINLPESVFGLPWNSDLVHQVVVAMTGNRRTPGRSHQNKRRSQRRRPEALETEGLGKARHGSIRSPFGWVEVLPTGLEKTKIIP